MTGRMKWLVGLALVAAAGRLDAQTISVPTGTVLSVQLDEPVSLDLKDAGKTYHGRLASPLATSRDTLLPAGADVEVTTRKPSGSNSKQAQVVLSQITVNGRANPVATTAARFLGTTAPTATADASGTPEIKTAQSTAFSPLNPSANSLETGAMLGFTLERALALR